MSVLRCRVAGQCVPVLAMIPSQRSSDSNSMRTLWVLVSGARMRLLLATGMSLIGGLCSAALVAPINQALVASRDELGALGWRFLAVGVAVLVARTASQAVFMSLGQDAKASLRMKTIERISNAPFSHVERQGGA